MWTWGLFQSVSCFFITYPQFLCEYFLTFYQDILKLILYFSSLKTNLVLVCLNQLFLQGNLEKFRNQNLNGICHWWGIIASGSFQGTGLGRVCTYIHTCTLIHTYKKSTHHEFRQISLIPIQYPESYLLLP